MTKKTVPIKIEQFSDLVNENGPVIDFPVVGIGASAGGLGAFEAFFSGMPTDRDPGMAFVVIQHLAPDHKSILAELIRRYTRMQVYEVEDGMEVKINCTYIIPPGRDMAFANGTLQLLDPASPRGQRLPIDFFFRTLALDQHEKAIAIVLSGTGSDGTLGVRAVKAEGGMILVQNPESTEYDGMPLSAIGTGLVDFVLPASEMSAKLLSYESHVKNIHPLLCVIAEPTAENSLKKIFVMLRTHTGHDFSNYKPSTIHRRIERRMALQQIDSIDLYVKYLQQNAGEVDALFGDLLIGVTNFFRDSEAFRVLEEQILPAITEAKYNGDTIRIWTPGCSTGEEAYSIAILLAERMELIGKTFSAQIFATDIDTKAIVIARLGLYPVNIVNDISPQRISRFFTADGDGKEYRIHKTIRDMLVFSEQDLIRDPPFSRLDLISCRNLMIYLGGELQKRMIPLFHYSLNPGGYLFLGTSETIGSFEDHFAIVDRKAKIYQRKNTVSGVPRFSLGLTAAPAKAYRVPRSFPEKKPSSSEKMSLRELTEQALLKQIDHAGALVDSQGDILYFHGRTGLYLEPSPGESRVNNILLMAREGLKIELTTALHKAVSTKKIVRCLNLRVNAHSIISPVDLCIRPVVLDTSAPCEDYLYLVIIEESSALSPDEAMTPAEGMVPETDDRIQQLKQELRGKDDYLQSINEEMQSSTEELKSSNEEMQSVNEELQSTNEELETSKEELQSVNEELATVNAELQIKVLDLSRANNDMNNLLAGTGIGTVFVDHNLRIMRFTPAASKIINLINSDIGRPVGHLASNMLNYNRLVSDVRDVLDTLSLKEIEIQTVENRWYMMRIQPYRTLENMIEGAVITYVDITEIKRTQEELKSANAQLGRLLVVLRDSSDAVTVHDLSGKIIAWNPGAQRLYGWSETEALEMNTGDRIPDEMREKEMSIIRKHARSGVFLPVPTRRLTKDGKTIKVSIVSSVLINRDGQVYAIATTERPNGD